MSYNVHDPFLTRKTPFFTLFILSRTSDNITSQNIGGDDAWAVLPPKILGDRPPSPPRFPPLQEKHPFYSFHTFGHIRQHYFSKYWGTNAWAVPPPQTLGGPSPQSPRFPPLRVVN